MNITTTTFDFNVTGIVLSSLSGFSLAIACLFHTLFRSSLRSFRWRKVFMSLQYLNAAAFGVYDVLLISLGDKSFQSATEFFLFGLFFMCLNKRFFAGIGLLCYIVGIIFVLVSNSFNVVYIPQIVNGCTHFIFSVISIKFSVWSELEEQLVDNTMSIN